MRKFATFVHTRKIGFFDKANRDWEKAWQMKLTPWDLKGTVVPPLVDAINSGIILPPGKKALVPGCGSGYECIYLRQAGFSKVIGLDLSVTAVDVANRMLEKSPVNDGVEFRVADFFAFESEKFDFIFDYLFFAALDPPLREKWGVSMKRLLDSNNGILATLIFPLRRENEDPNTGPPYPVVLNDYERVLSKHNFELIKVDEVRC